MPSDRKPSLFLPMVVTLAVLLGLYVGAYYAMVQPAVGSDFYALPWEPYDDFHGAAADRCSLLFRPIHRLDRRLRPHLWEP